MCCCNALTIALSPEPASWLEPQPCCSFTDRFDRPDLQLPIQPNHYNPVFCYISWLLSRVDFNSSLIGEARRCHPMPATLATETDCQPCHGTEVRFNIFYNFISNANFLFRHSTLRSGSAHANSVPLRLPALKLPLAEARWTMLLILHHCPLFRLYYTVDLLSAG